MKISAAIWLCLWLWACETRVEVLRDAPSDAATSGVDATVADPEPLDCSQCSALELCAVDRCVDTIGVTALRSGLRHVCIVQDARLRCWGNNGSGQLGVGDEDDRDRPTRVGRSEQWLDVAAGQEHTCALHAPGEVFCWGENSTGQLGLGDTRPRGEPARITGLMDVAQLACGGDNCCALRLSGVLECWGDNHQGVPGQDEEGRAADVLEPARVAGQERYVQVSVGEAHACAIDTGGELSCWGRNNEGQLGVGLTQTHSRTPLPIGSAKDFQGVAAGQHHTCAIRGGGELYCWGTNDFFELGIGTGSLDDARVDPEPVRVGTDADWVSVAVGWFHTCALKRNGALYCWGRAAEGQLGVASTEPVSAPMPVAPTQRFRGLALGSFYTCALDADRAVYCWGANTDGQLGTGDNEPRAIPTRVSL
jgi:alpha-tubulin suppressor-like RCC1 family protein